MPEIHEPIDFNSFIANPFENSLNLIATNKTDFNSKPFSEFAGRTYTDNVGPEGGFSMMNLLLQKMLNLQLYH